MIFGFGEFVPLVSRLLNQKMTKTAFATIILFLAFVLYASSQSCLPGITYFTNQDQIDNFKIDYPGCTEIIGTLWIMGDSVTNLSGFDVLTKINGELQVHGTSILDLKGLESISYIGGDIEIGGNDTLLSLEGLDGLDTIHNDLVIGSLFSGNDWLPNLSGLENITVFFDCRFFKRSNEQTVSAFRYCFFFFP